MENKTLLIALISIFYIFGLTAFYADNPVIFAPFVCLLLIYLCLKNLLKPAFCVILCFLFFGGYINAKVQNKEYDSLSGIYSANNVAINGTIASIPKVNAEKNRATFFLNTDRAEISGKELETFNTKILVSLTDKKERYENIKIGDTVEFRGKLRTPYEASNPGEFDYQKYLQNKDALKILYVKGDDFRLLRHPDIKKARSAKDLANEVWWKTLQGLDLTRDKIIKKHAKYIKSPNLEVFGGIVFGDDAVNPPDEVKQSFINSGLLHLLAASGLNVALIFGIMWAVASFLNLPYKANILAGMAIVVLYTFMTGFPPSIMRASVMLLLILAGKLMFKTADNFVLIFFTAFIMLLFNPKLLNDVGFELSFLVTGGLIGCIDPVLAHFKNADKAYKKKFFKKPKIIAAAAFLFSPLSILGVILVPLTAQLWAAPLQMYYFNTFTPYSVLANIAVVPFIGIISFVGFICSIVSLVPFLGNCAAAFAGFTLNPLITILLNISNFFSTLPGSIIKMPSGSVFQMFLYYVLISIFVYCIGVKFQNKKFNTALLTVAAVFLATLIKIPNGNFEILAYNVGNADNFLVKTPKNKYIMIDTGKLPYEGVSSARRVTLEDMYDRNIRTLEYLIVTHFDNDHSGGVIDILDNIRVKNVIVQKNSCDTKNSCRILEYLKKNNINYKVARDETVYKENNRGKNLEIKTFTPGIKDGGLSGDRLENENSIITLINLGGDYMLFMGDGGIRAFNAIKDRLPSDISAKGIKILKAGHHGAKYTTDKNMLSYLKPRSTIISTGPNPYGHPDTGTIKLLENSGSNIYSTKNLGAVKFVFKDNKTEIYGFLGEDRKKGFRRIDNKDMKNGSYFDANLQINL